MVRIDTDINYSSTNSTPLNKTIKINLKKMKTKHFLAL